MVGEQATQEDLPSLIYSDGENGLFVTSDGKGIGMVVAGHTIVRPIRDWHAWMLAKERAEHRALKATGAADAE
jgi:hypothetical protein